jgi:hypothetical protein
MSRQILNGWKEISNYIRRSVRTVQRWEARLGLPVYRPALKDGSAVVAFSDDLDRWISRVSPDAGEEDTVLNGIEEKDAGHLRMLDTISTMTLDTAELSSQMRLLQEQLRQSLRISHDRIASKTRVHTTPMPSRDMGSVLSFQSWQDGQPLEGMVFRADAPGTAAQQHGNGNGRIPGRAPIDRRKG